MDKNFNIYDYFEGDVALNQHIIKTVGDAKERFKEDALRILRGLRFQSQLNFTIEGDTFEGDETSNRRCRTFIYRTHCRGIKKLIKGQNVSQSYLNLIDLNFFNYVPFFRSLDMKQTKVNSPISFELWIAILLTVEQTNTSLSDLK